MSNLQISISAEEQSNSFFLYDCTGSFSHDNPTGYGGPNPKVSDISSAVLVVNPPSVNLPVSITPGQLDTIQITPVPTPSYTLNLYPNFPDCDNDKYGYEVLPFMVGTNNNTIPSGKYVLQLTVGGLYGPTKIPFTSTTILEVVFIKQVTCCIDRLQKQLNVANFKDNKSKTIIELINLLDSAEKNICCGLLDQANGIIGLLENQCNCVGC